MKSHQKRIAIGLGPVRADELYPLPVLKALMGLGAEGWSDLRKKGIKTVKSGHRTYVLGEHVIEVMRRLADLSTTIERKEAAALQEAARRALE